MSLLATFLARWIGAKWAGLIADLLPFLAVAAVVWWVMDMRATIDQQAGEISATRSELTAEKVARQRDVAGLTTLAKGQANVAAQSKTDQKILTETVAHAPVTPSSPALAALLGGLRAADSQQHAASAAAK